MASANRDVPEPPWSPAGPVGKWFRIASNHRQVQCRAFDRDQDLVLSSLSARISIGGQRTTAPGLPEADAGSPPEAHEFTQSHSSAACADPANATASAADRPLVRKGAISQSLILVPVVPIRSGS